MVENSHFVYMCTVIDRSTFFLFTKYQNFLWIFWFPSFISKCHKFHFLKKVKVVKIYRDLSCFENWRSKYSKLSLKFLNYPQPWNVFSKQPFHLEKDQWNLKIKFQCLAKKVFSSRFCNNMKSFRDSFCWKVFRAWL